MIVISERMKIIGQESEEENQDVLIECQNRDCRWLYTVDYCRKNYLCEKCRQALPIAVKLK